MLPVLFEDESIIAVNKPGGLPVHGSGGPEDTVETVLRRQLGGRAVRSGYTVSAAHRLDRDTSGVLLLARRRRAAQRLMDQFQAGTVHKTYLALVIKGPAQDEGVIDRPLAGLGRHAGTLQEAQTAFRVLGRSTEAALLECRPRTGRTHQIRRHLASLGTPIGGDPTYGSDRFNDWARAQWGLGRLFLHARALTFTHPDDGRALTLEAALPPDLAEVLRRAGVSAG